MPDPGGGPGRDPPDDSGPSDEEVEDLSVGPGPDVSADAYRQKIIDRLMQIGGAEEKLKSLRAEHRNFRAKYCQAWSKNRSAMKPELMELERKVKKQALFLQTLKEKSGALKEKFANEQRFATQVNPCTSSMDRPSQASDEPAPSASAPLPPRQDWGSPVATSQGVESEHGALEFIQQMESPLREDKFCFSEDPAEFPEDGQRRYRPAKPVPVERSRYTKMAPGNVSAPTTAVEVSAGEVREEVLCKQPESLEASKEKLREEPTEDVKVKALTDVILPSGHIEEEHVEKSMDMELSALGNAGSSSESASAKMAASCKDSVPAMPPGGQHVIAGGGGGAELSADREGGIESVLSVNTSIPIAQPSAVLQKKMEAEDGGLVCADSAVKITESLHQPADNTNEGNVLLVGGGSEGVNVSSSAMQTAMQPMQSATASTSAWNGGNYASVLRSATRGGGGTFSRPGHNVGKFGAGIVGGFNRRNVVQLKWEGEGTPPVRGRVVDLILEMGFKAIDVFALICPLGSYEYDLSFMKPEGLDLFWERYERCKGLSQWGGLVPKVISRQPLVKSVTILVRNESIPEADLAVWLRRYGEVLTPLRKTLDEHGIWTGAWTVSLKLRVLGNVVQHLPSSAFLGRDRLTIFYQGQPRVCNRCGEKGHYALSCTLRKCSLCQGLGHLARECTQIRCNLCQQLGHPYSQCPEALHNLPGLETELRRLDKEDEAADVREDADVAPPSVSIASESVNVSPSNVAPESVPSVVSSIVKAHRSSRLAEAAGGAGLADPPPRLVSPPVPLPRQRKRGQRGVEGLGRDGVDGVEGGVSISHVSPSPEVDPADQGWERGNGKKKKKKRRVSKIVCSDPDSDIGDIPLGNRYAVLSGDEMLSDPSSSLSSMDEGESRCLKRAVSGDEGVVEVKKRLPQSS